MLPTADPWSHLPQVIGGLAGLTIFTLVLGVGREWQLRHRSPLQRLQLAQLPDIREAHTDVLPSMARLGQATYATRLESELRQAGLMVTAGEFMLAITFFLAIGLLVSWWSQNFMLGIFLLLGALFGPRQWLRFRLARRARDFERQLPAMIDNLASSMRTGKSLQQALEHAAREMSMPMSTELRRVVRNIQLLSGGMEEALQTFSLEMQSIDLELIVSALLMQLKAGGNIAQMLDSIARTIRDRVTLKGDMQALSAQQRFSGIVLGLMPVVLVGALLVFNPHYLLGVFATTVWCGWLMFAVATVMIALGMIVMRKMVDMKV